MKYVIATLCISMFLINISAIHAGTGNTMLPQPSLITQMQKQEKINKKNDTSNRLREQARIKKEAKEHLVQLQYQRLIKKNAQANPVV